jgi:hypothetical protein
MPPPLVVEVAASVTPRRHPAGPTVLDEHRQPGARGSAAGLGGDVVGTDQIPVPLQSTAGAVESAARGLGNPLLAGRASGGGSPLIYQPHHHPHQFGLVPQGGLQQVGTAPPPQPEVLHPAHVLVGDACGVAHDEGADPLLDGEGDDLLGGLVLGLVDAAAMARLDPAQASPMAAPAPRPSLAGPGCAAGGSGVPCLLILKMQVALGAERPPRHQQPRGLGGDREGVDDP